jgi:hypothetical protein
MGPDLGLNRRRAHGENHPGRNQNTKATDRTTGHEGMNSLWKKRVARPAWIEHATRCLEGSCSGQLSYGRNRLTATTYRWIFDRRLTICYCDWILVA